MGALSRRKGACGEREIVKLARELGFTDAKRTAPMQAGYGAEYPDVDGIPLLWIEAKCYRQTPVNRFAREHVDKERPGFIPVLAWRDERTEWRATLALSELLKLLKRAEIRGFREENNDG